MSAPPHSSLSGFAPPAPGPTPVQLQPFGQAPPPASDPASAPAPPPVAHQQQPARAAPQASPAGQTQGAKRTTPACQRCRRGKVKCVTVDGQLPCQACIARGHEESCVRGEKGKAADDRLPRVRKRPVDELDGETAPGSSSSSAAYPSRRTSFPHSTARPSRGGPGSSGGAGAGPYAGSPTPPSPTMWPPQQGAHAPLAPASGTGAAPALVAVKREEGGTETVLPPLPVLIAGCESFFEGYFQLGFLHRPSFLHQLQTKPETVSTFLLLSMLAISARFVPALVAKHGSPTRASDHYAARAQEMVFAELVTPTLAAVQGLYLLAIHDFGNGCAFRSKVLQSVARQMADALKLHEDLPDASAIDNEVRRRTWWFLTLDANLLNNSGATSSSFDPVTVPIPLPSQEQDFTFGVRSRVVQYFPEATSAAAKQNPLVPGEMSLLGALISIIAIFGRTARALAGTGGGAGPVDGANATVPPWQAGSLLRTTQDALHAWLSTLDPARQKWSTSNLLAYRGLHLDLGFWCCYADFHAINILVRRAYLPQMIRALAPSSRDDPAASALGGVVPPEGRVYWAGMAEQLVSHAFDLVELQEEVAGGRPATTGITPHLSFCIYLAGTILNYLRICPWLCPSRASSAPSRIASALEMLQHIATVWPLAERWHRSLYAQATSPTAPHGPLGMRGSSPTEAAGLARADLHLDTEAGLYRQYAPAGAALDEASPAAGKMDAASALAAMSGAAVAGGASAPPPVVAAESVPPSSAAQHARHSSAVSGLLRAAAVGDPPRAPLGGEFSSSAPTSVSSFGGGSGEPHAGSPATSFSGLFTPHPEGGIAAADDARALEQLLSLDLGDLGELSAFLAGYGYPGGLEGFTTGPGAMLG